jgi:hypothetical protein
MNCESAWQSLAELYNLVYVPQHQWQKARVTGRYRGYQLHLSSYLFGLEIILTAVSALPRPPVSPLTEKDITPLFLNPYLSNPLGGYFRAQDCGRRFFYHQINPSRRDDLQSLQQLLNHLCDLADSYRQLLVLGGEVVPFLLQGLAHYPKFSRLARQLLQDIVHETEERLAQNKTGLLCHQCLWRAEPYPLGVPGRIESLGLSYYRCRFCRQSGKLDEYRQLVCVLDETMTVPYMAKQGIWRVNWLIHRRLFDFEGVELIQAGEVEVEKFAIQVANNTEPQQKAAYRRMTCQVGPDCPLSPNTLTLLGRLFGKVSLYQDK